MYTRHSRTAGDEVIVSRSAGCTAHSFEDHSWRAISHLRRLRAEGASVSGAETGGDFQVSGAVNADLSSEASNTKQTSSSTSV